MSLDRGPWGPPAGAATGWPAPVPGGGTFVPYDWSPPAAPRRRRRRGARSVMALALLLVAAGAGGLGWLSWYNHRAASRWERLEQARAASLAAVTGQLQVANSRIVTLDQQVSGLNGQVTGLQQQLSSVANQKEKAVDRETVLQQLLAAAGQVADDLQQCISATNQFETDLNTAIVNSDFSSAGALEAQGQQVDSTCSAAESANSSLQTAISGAS